MNIQELIYPLFLVRILEDDYAVDLKLIFKHKELEVILHVWHLGVVDDETQTIIEHH